MKDLESLLVKRLVFSRGVSDKWCFPEYFNILRGKYDYKTVNICISVKVRLSIKLSIRGTINISISNKVNDSLFQSYISPLSSFQKLEVTSRILGEL